MAWGVQGMRVTLEDTKTGETLVIEQNPDGKIACQEKSSHSRAKHSEQKKGEGDVPPAANTAPKTTGKSSSAAKPNGEKPVSGENEKPASSKPTRRMSSPRRSTSLKWSPVQDHGYHGFRAPSGGGFFKVLKAKASQWALFFEPAGADARHVGCFAKEDPAKTKAQELHDKGWPASEVRGVTAEDVARACPVPDSEGSGRRTRMKRETTTETKPETTPAAPAAAAKPEPASAPPAAPPPASTPAAAGEETKKDKELMDNFTGGLENMLDEDGEDE